MQLPQGTTVQAVKPETKPVPQKSSRSERVQRLPDNLPVVEEVIDPECTNSFPNPSHLAARTGHYYHPSSRHPQAPNAN